MFIIKQEYLPIQEIKDVGLSKSRSAPSVLNPHTCSQLQQHNTPLHTMYSDSSYSHQCEVSNFLNILFYS